MSKKYTKFINYIVDDIINHTTIDKEFDFLPFDFVSLKYDDGDRCDIPLPYLKAKYETLKSYDDTSKTFMVTFTFPFLSANQGIINVPSINPIEKNVSMILCTNTQRN